MVTDTIEFPVPTAPPAMEQMAGVQDYFPPVTAAAVPLEPDIVLRPFSAQEWTSFYYNRLIDHDKQSLDEFLRQGDNPNAHPLYNVLVTYRRSLRLVRATKTQVKQQRETCENISGRVWTITPDKAMKRGKCGCDVVLTAEVTFETAFCDNELLTQLSGDMHKLNFLFHEDLVEHRAPPFSTQV
jgi:hypothetical protein